MNLRKTKVFGVLIFFAFLCGLPTRAYAQFTTVSATITDSNGLPYSNASVQAQLIPTGVTPTINGQAVSGFVRSSADVTGTFSMNLASNAVLSPGGTQWQFTVNETPGIAPPAGTGPQSFVVTLTISGASQSISANLSAVAPVLSRGGVVNGAGSNPLGASLNVKGFPYSAIADGIFLVDGVTNGANNQLTSATATFRAGLVGYTITCYKTPLSGTNAAWSAGQTTVASFVNSSTITYAGANATALSGLYCTITNPADHAGIDQAFLDAKSTSQVVGSAGTYQNPARTLYFPTGLFGLDKGFDNLISTGNESCVAFKGDDWTKSVLIPEFTFTPTTHNGVVINDTCAGGYLEGFTIELASNPITGKPNGGTIQTGGNEYVHNVSVFDQCYQGVGGNMFGFLVPSGSDLIFDHPRVIGAGTCNTPSGGILWTASEGDIYSPFLSNTPQNFFAVNCPAGNNGAGSRVWGGVIDEGSISLWQNCVDFWSIGTTWTGGANCVSIDATSYVWFFGGYCGTFATNTGSGPTVASGGVAVFTGMHVRGQNAANYCWNAVTLGGIIDDGGNLCTLAGGATFNKAGAAANLSALSHGLTNFTEGVVNLAASSIGIWTPDQAITVTRIMATNSAGNITCATPLVLQLSNGTTTQTLTLTSGVASWDTGVISQPFVAGTLILLSQTAAGACATPPVNLNVSILWNASQGP